jgi:hypothetical protein
MTIAVVGALHTDRGDGILNVLGVGSRPLALLTNVLRPLANRSSFLVLEPFSTSYIKGHNDSTSELYIAIAQHGGSAGWISSTASAMGD